MYEDIEKDLGWKTNTKVKKGYDILDDVIITCPNCSLQLIQVIKVKESDKKHNFKVICPDCGEESFIVWIYGDIFVSGMKDLIVVEDNVDYTSGIYSYKVKLLHEKV